MAPGGDLVRILSSQEDGFEAAFHELEARREATGGPIDVLVAEVVEDVRRRGDDALLDAVERFDGYRLSREQVALSAPEIEEGAARLPTRDRQALRTAADRIRRFHEARAPLGWTERDADGLLGQRVRPLERVGLYVPAGRAPLASTVLMLGIPARSAGVPFLVVATPGREIHPAVLEAARLVGVSCLVRVGGAQAVAAMAFGTGRVPRVDKIVGPGNAYVQAAKRRVFGEVAIDAEAGPSEVLIVADRTASPQLAAADLLAQAEHDEMASVVLATPSGALARDTREELERQIRGLPLEAVARRSLAGRSALIVTRDLDEALGLANRFAPEHLQLLVAEPERCLGRIENAGAVFLGPESPVPVGDYVAGPSHVLPTGGTARFFSVVGVEDFVKRMSVIQLSAHGIRRLGGTAVRLAELEGLEAHARALRRRLDRES